MVDRAPPRALLIVLLPVLIGMGTGAAEAQQNSQPQQPQQIPQQPQFQTQQSAQWATMPRMLLERQFAGPLQDTIVQRWRDPADGTVCYIYLPITAPHSPPTASGFVQYGGNMIGSISCMPSPPASHAAASPRHPATAAQGQ
ncbi:conserved exported hypothetical protein [Bradyrhizobium sp. STM 3843]|uniref:hypothetical protein n=1 Tax=Bradyrhizobium sp. STM 3843 TaxID=551947 RepID=UPI0002403069|nr:hypothetical protein [Bradyrhizobium sp. STM 3843]CCE08830.1 conserved exported hypothetical protein [Bradyrhizobium sp. STM 3843]